ncbi:hypothetical protein J5289_21370 [Rhizobium sp. B230/85]|uniref:hypothetical protein n=1 Tax=unclassified Rhizobium TaxID=2613769 RepID=UPI001ADADA53|nr:MULTISPECIES: hypothetical protein [unclassified Rhizobium]MBO9135157.1 hypothetical protein [Rhizobium sp. B209b/85]QXZ99052.1 hypothetical protein J5289_21370 [Rhizobium sp. B230/85]
MKIAILVISLSLRASAALGQQYRNYEVQPDGMGGYTGTDGNRNFEVTPQNGGRIVRHPNTQRERSVRRPGDMRSQPNCVVDGYGNAICR